MRSIQITQRPDYCTINPESPLACGLVFGGFGLMGCYGSNQYFDSSLLKNSGALNGYSSGPTWSRTNGRPALAIAVGQYVSSGINTWLGGATTAWISAWLYKPVSAANQIVAGFGSSSGDVYAFFVDWYSNGTIYFEANNGSANNGMIAQASGGWVHVFMQFNGNLSGNARLLGYINGVAQSLSYSGTPAATLATAASLGTAIAGKETASANNVGSIADLMIGIGTVPAAMIPPLADRTNILLEIGGVPLLLPGRHRDYKALNSRRRRFLLGV
jgi:hypothetical protein